MKALEKFHEDKTYKFFPGVAIIHFIGKGEVKKLLSNITKEMKQSGLFEKYVFLPESSYHSTISDILTYNDLNSNPDYSSFALKDEQDIEAIDRFVIDTLKENQFKLKVKMVPTKITARKIHLKPMTMKDKIKLNEFRIKVANKIQIKYNNIYQFHISLSYQLSLRTDAERDEIDNYLEQLNKKYIGEFEAIEMDVCDLVLFNNMAEFKNITVGRDASKTNHE